MIKRIRVLAGPNGSGKTTLFHELEKKIRLYDFINADEIKLLLEKSGSFALPFTPEPGEFANTVLLSSFDEAVKEPVRNGLIQCCGQEILFTKDSVNTYTVAALTEFLRSAYMKRGLSFTLETVFSHPSKLQFLAQANKLGYRVYLYFVATNSPELNVERVRQRVEFGGHDVPQDKIISRYYRCLDNFYDALPFAYRAFFMDNSTHEMKFFAELKPNHSIEIIGDIPPWFDRCILKRNHG